MSYSARQVILIGGRTRDLDTDIRLTFPWESPSTRLPSLLPGVMEGGRMWKEEVSFLQADCWMERLRDGQMTIGGRRGPECRLGETRTLLLVGSGRGAKCTQKRPSQRIWQGDPFTHPSPAPLSPFIPLQTSPLFLPSFTPNREVMS